jgi:hypothetical protein
VLGSAKIETVEGCKFPLASGDPKAENNFSAIEPDEILDRGMIGRLTMV